MPFPSNAETRDLQFPLDRSLVAIDDTGIEEIIDPQLTWQTTDSDERVNIVLNLSLNEFVGLATCIDVGSDIAYGDDAILLWWTWVRSLNSVDICTALIECINNNPATQAALETFITNTGVGGFNQGDTTSTTIYGTRFPANERSQPVAPPPAGCDNDALWSGIRETVSRLDDNARNFLEDMVTFSDKAERLSGIVAAIPIVGGIVSEVMNQFIEVIPDLLNAYNAYSSETVIDEISCHLFELVCDTCVYPSFDDYMNYYSGSSVPELQVPVNLSVQAAVSGVVTSAGFAQALIYHSFVTFQLWTLYLSAKFNGASGTNTLALWASLGEDLPTDNWIALCDGCGELCYEWDFTIDAQGWAIWSTGSRPYGVYVAGVGWQCTWDNLGGFDNRIYIENLNWAASTNVTRVEVDVIPTAGGASRQGAGRVMNGTTAQSAVVFTPTTVINSTLQEVAANIVGTGDGLRVNFTTDTGSDDQDALTIEKIRVYYTSGQPEDGSQC